MAGAAVPMLCADGKVTRRGLVAGRSPRTNETGVAAETVATTRAGPAALPQGGGGWKIIFFRDLLALLFFLRQ